MQFDCINKFESYFVVAVGTEISVMHEIVFWIEVMESIDFFEVT